MSQPNIAKCYDEIVEDPSQLWLYQEKEYSSLWEVPLLGAVQFKLISERPFTCISSPDIWGRMGWSLSPTLAKDQWGSHPHSDPNYRWGRRRKHGYGDHLLLPWSSQDAGLWCTLYPTSMWLARAKCGCSEKMHQHPYIPQGTSYFPY